MFIKHANELLENENYSGLTEMLDNDYLLTPIQENKVAKKVFKFLFEETIYLKNVDYKKETDLLNLFQNYGDKIDLSYHLDSKLSKRFEDLRYMMSFPNLFFYKLCLNSFNQNVETPTLKTEQNNNLIKTGLNIIIQSLNVLKDSSKINKKSSIQNLLFAVPIEFYPYIYKNVNNLYEYSSQKQTKISAYEEYKSKIDKMSKEGNILPSQKVRLENLERAFHKATEFISNNFGANEIKEVQGKDKHSSIIDLLKNQNNKNNQHNIDFESYYHLKEHTSKDITNLLKNLKVKYDELKSEPLDIESSHQLSKLPLSIFHILENYEITKEFLDSAESDAIEHLTILHNTLKNMQESIIESKVNTLAVNSRNKKQQLK